MRVPTYQTVIPGIEVVRLGAPLNAQIELTEGCNYGCRFCYNVWKESGKHKKVQRLSRTQAIGVIEKLIACRVFSLILSGGEPTSCKFLPELVALATSGGIETSLITNGSLLTVELLEALLESGLQSVQISMHHHNPGAMDWITQRQGSFCMTQAGVKNALAVLGPDLFNVNMVVTRATVEEVYEMGAYLNNLGVRNFSVGMVSFCGEAALNGISVGQKGFLRVYAQLKQINHDFGISVSLTGGMPMCVVPGNGNGGIVQVSNICDAGINQIVIGPDGGMRPCVEYSTVVGNALTDDIPTVWTTSKELDSIRRFENVPPSCHSCPLVGGCHGGCRAAATRFTNDPQGLDPMMTEE